MENQVKKNEFESLDIGEQSLYQSLFVEHLIRIYCAKSHLTERLPELLDQKKFEDLHPLIADILAEDNMALEKTHKVFEISDHPVSLKDCGDIIGIMENAYSKIHNQADDIFYRNITLLSYLQNIADLQSGSLQILEKVVAKKLYNQHITLLISNIQKNAKKLSALFLLINT